MRTPKLLTAMLLSSTMVLAPTLNANAQGAGGPDAALLANAMNINSALFGTAVVGAAVGTLIAVATGGQKVVPTCNSTGTCIVTPPTNPGPDPDVIVEEIVIVEVVVENIVTITTGTGTATSTSTSTSTSTATATATATAAAS